MTELFTKPDTWSGGFYELALEFAPGSDGPLDMALKTIWGLPFLQGCYLRSDLEPSQQPRVAPALATLESHGHPRGVARLPDGRSVACGTYLVREESGPDWLGFYVPMGALEAVYEVGGYPFEQDSDSQRWRESLEEWLAGIGTAVFPRAAFRIGLVGFEVSGDTSARELRDSGVPARRPMGLLYPEGNKLIWYPTNQWQ
jgi:hypothetical protein